MSSWGDLLKANFQIVLGTVISGFSGAIGMTVAILRDRRQAEREDRREDLRAERAEASRLSRLRRDAYSAFLAECDKMTLAGVDGFETPHVERVEVMYRELARVQILALPELSEVAHRYAQLCYQFARSPGDRGCMERMLAGREALLEGIRAEILPPSNTRRTLT